ncbi:hypothetical protein [Microcoleus sp.]|uniref:hypothetical protein n=1 Tax=Microcoleus sp. TaxID=44472 RepID=UPI0035238C2A
MTERPDCAKTNVVPTIAKSAILFEGFPSDRFANANDQKRDRPLFKSIFMGSQFTYFMNFWWFCNG